MSYAREHNSGGCGGTKRNHNCGGSNLEEVLVLNIICNFSEMPFGKGESGGNNKRNGLCGRMLLVINVISLRMITVHTN